MIWKSLKMMIVIRIKIVKNFNYLLIGFWKLLLLGGNKGRWLDLFKGYWG